MKISLRSCITSMYLEWKCIVLFQKIVDIIYFNFYFLLSAHVCLSEQADIRKLSRFWTVLKIQIHSSTSIKM